MKKIYLAFFCLIIITTTTTGLSAQNVGIGIADPEQKLHIAGFVRSDSLAGTGFGLLLADSLGTILRKDFTGDSTEFLAGNGTWIDISAAGGECDWVVFDNTTTNKKDMYSCVDGNVGIGTSTPGHVLHIVGSRSASDSTLIFVENFSTASMGGIEVRNMQASNDAPAVEGIVHSGFGSAVQGIHFHTSGGGSGVTGYTISPKGFGVSGLHAPQTASSGGGAGVWGVAYSNNSSGTGVKGESYGTAGIGVHGQVSNSSGIAVKGTNPSPTSGWAGYFIGKVFAQGNYTISDKRFKKNIEPINNALGKILNLEPKEYQFNTDKYPGLRMDPEESHFGFIAQDLAEVIPEAVTNEMTIEDPTVIDTTGTPDMVTGYYLVDYQSLTPILVQAIKEQQAIINSLEGKNEELERRVSALEQIVKK